MLGTKTIAGYASEFQHWAYGVIPQMPQSYFVSTHQPASVGVQGLAGRIDVLQGLRNLPQGWTNKQNYEELEKWLSSANEAWIDQDYKYSTRNQIFSLFSMLNRKDMFEDLTAEGSIGYHLYGQKPRGLVNFLI